MNTYLSDEYYIGVLSGTSMDAVDVALVSFNGLQPQLIHTLSYPIPETFRSHCLTLCQSGNGSIDDYGSLDANAGEIFSRAVLALLKAVNLTANKIRAIGSHGQTLRHRPEANPPFTLQIGDPNIIAERTGIPTVADFRRRDIAAGGQGAPLAPGFHAAVFGFEQSSAKGMTVNGDQNPAKRMKDKGTINNEMKDTRVIVNIGGISNITILTKDPSTPIIGFDTGPGNCLMDGWAKTHWNIAYDKNGEIAASGRVQEELLTQLLNDPFFKKDPPKSTGRDYFNQAWLNHYLISEQSTKQQTQQSNQYSTQHYNDKDVQATLLALTAHSLVNDIMKYAPMNAEVYVCGGGVHNKHLMQTLNDLLARSVLSTESLGLHPDWVEAILFAWLAKQTLSGKTGNCPSVTGARHAIPLGGIFGFRPVNEPVNELA